jgi:CubicO group peptidase (beta-lactamase class C family)
MIPSAPAAHGSLHRRKFLALSGAALLASPAQGADANRESLAGDIADRLAATHTPGIGVAMVKAGHPAFVQGYGYGDVEKARHVTPETIFQIASVSKTVTATALMLLWQDGAFRLDDPVAPHLDFAVASPAFPNVPVTFRQLLTHTSGISDAVYDKLDFSTGDLPPLRDFLEAYLVPGGKCYDARNSWSAAKPGTAWSYSNVAVALLGYLGGRLSGRPFETFTRERIFQPLGMNATSWRYEGVSDARLAQPYGFADARFKRLPRARYPDWPAGLLCTSPNDFALFLASHYKASLLKPETIRTMFTPDPVIVNPQSRIKQGLIWELTPMGGSSIALHTGGDPGVTSFAAIDTTHGTAALCFANVTPDKDKSQFEKEVIRRLFAMANGS